MSPPNAAGIAHDANRYRIYSEVGSARSGHDVYLLYASVAYTGYGAIIGIAIVALGVPIVWASSRGALASSR